MRNLTPFLGLLAVMTSSSAWAVPALPEQVKCSRALSEISNAMIRCRLPVSVLTVSGSLGSDTAMNLQAHEHATPKPVEGFYLGENAFALPNPKGEGFWILSDSQEGVAHYQPDKKCWKTAGISGKGAFPLDPSKAHCFAKVDVPGKGSYFLILESQSSDGLNAPLKWIRNMSEYTSLEVDTDPGKYQLLDKSKPDIREKASAFLLKHSPMSVPQGMRPLNEQARLEVAEALRARIKRIRDFFVVAQATRFEQGARCLQREIGAVPDLGSSSCSGIAQLNQDDRGALDEIKREISNLGRSAVAAPLPSGPASGKTEPMR